MSDPHEIIICGLDGVLALIEHRLHHLYNDEGVRHWDRFLDACDGDMPNLDLIERLNKGRDAGVKVVIITGRNASARARTERWLAQWHIGYDALWMRPGNDFSKAGEYKAAIIRQHYPGMKIRRVYESAQHLDVARWCEQQMIPCTLIGYNQGNGESREQYELKTINHACGHVVLHPFYGDDDYAWLERKQQLAASPCRVCQADEQERERQHKADQARLFARERGLPPLEGSERQVAWAESVRLTAFSAVDKVQKWIDENDARAAEEDPDYWYNVKQGVKRSIEFLETQVDAKWWIDHRGGIINSLDGGRALLSSIAQEMGYL